MPAHMEQFRNPNPTDGPRRILAIEDSIERLEVAIAYLESIEETLRQRGDRKDLRLRDYFDLIGGEGSGALLGALLAGGRTVGETAAAVETLDRGSGPAARAIGWMTRGRRNGRVLRDMFGDTRLGDVPSNLAMLAYRLDLDCPFVFLTGQDRRPQPWMTGDPELLLADCVDACMTTPPRDAAFAARVGGESPEAILTHAAIGMAGGAGPPLFSIATDPEYELGWATGESRLLLVSVASGRWTPRMNAASAARRSMIEWATELPGMLVRDARRQARLYLESIARVATPPMVDEGAENTGATLVLDEPAMTYVQYDTELDESALGALELKSVAESIDRLRRPDPQRDGRLVTELGRTVAARDVKADHFPPAFDSAPYES